VTNNSTKSRAGYMKKFTGLGLDVKAEEIFSSSFAAAAYLESINFAATGKKAYVVGETGVLAGGLLRTSNPTAHAARIV
jgi:phosphoglycolate phosphatase